MKPLLLFLSFVAILPLSSAATIRGATYNYLLDPISDVVLNINTTPAQVLVVKDSNYTLEVGAGSYELNATYASGTQSCAASVNITIRDDGTYTRDLILLPDWSIEGFVSEPPLSEELAINETQLEPPQHEQQKGQDFIMLYTMLALILIVSVLIIFVWKKTGDKTKVVTIPDDLGGIVKIIEGNDGRITQRELRNRLPHSEAKVSLMLADLEHRGLIDRFKKGRGNVIRLKKGG